MLLLQENRRFLECKLLHQRQLWVYLEIYSCFLSFYQKKFVWNAAFVFKNGKSLELSEFGQYTLGSEHKVSPNGAGGPPCEPYLMQDYLKYNCSQPSTLKSQQQLKKNKNGSLERNSQFVVDQTDDMPPPPPPLPGSHDYAPSKKLCDQQHKLESDATEADRLVSNFYLYHITISSSLSKFEIKYWGDGSEEVRHCVFESRDLRSRTDRKNNQKK